MGLAVFAAVHTPATSLVGPISLSPICRFKRAHSRWRIMQRERLKTLTDIFSQREGLLGAQVLSHVTCRVPWSKLTAAPLHAMYLRYSDHGQHTRLYIHFFHGLASIRLCRLLPCMIHSTWGGGGGKGSFLRGVGATILDMSACLYMKRNVRGLADKWCSAGRPQ